MAARKLKVFQAQFGFYDTVVAAASQAAALRAWGVHQNLFASGEARITTDAATVAAATAHPEAVLKRPVGSKAAFEIDPASLPDVPDAPKRANRTANPSSHAKPKPRRRPPDRARLDRSEAALRSLEEARTAEEDHLRERQMALDADREEAQARYAEARRAAISKLDLARAAFRKAGGDA